MSQDTSTSENVRMNFFDYGFQYYVAARFAARAGLVPVAGNLFHHAIEMFLKGALAKHLDLPQLEKFRHRLVDLWLEFKEQDAAMSAVASFDPIVRALNKFEEIRYPDKLVMKGMNCRFEFIKATSIVHAGPPRIEPDYELFVGDIDALVKAIVTASEINSPVFTSRYVEHGGKYLQFENQETDLWVAPLSPV